MRMHSNLESLAEYNAIGTLGITELQRLCVCKELFQFF